MPKTTKSATANRSNKAGIRLKARFALSPVMLAVFLLVFASIGYVVWRFSSAATNTRAHQSLGVYAAFTNGSYSNAPGFRSFESWLGRELKYTDLNLSHHCYAGCASPITSGAWANYSQADSFKTLPRVTTAITVPLHTRTDERYSQLRAQGDAALTADSKAGLEATARGDNDNYYRTIANYMVNNGHSHTIIRLGHEPEIRYYPWSFKGGNHEVYKQAFRRIHGVMKSVPGNNFKFDYQGNGEWNLANPSAGNLKNGDAGYPGDAYVDIIGVDVYDKGSWSSVKGRLDYAKDLAIRHGKPVSIPEWGLWIASDGGNGDNPQFVQNIYDWVNALPASGPGSIAYHAYFDGFSKSRLSQFPNAQAKFKQLYGPLSSTATPPPPSPTPTPSPPPASTPSPTPQPAPGQPDLIVTDLSWAPANPKVGQEVVFTAVIKNQGTAATPDNIIHGVAFSLNGGSYTWSDTSKTSLAAGQSRTLTANWGSADKNSWTAKNGSFTVQAHVDDVNRIPNESSETNNKLTKTLTTVVEPVVSDPVDTQKPTQPGNLRSTIIGQNQIAIAWDASSDNKAVTGYHVYRNGTKVASPSTTSFTDSGLNPATTYKYQVSAYDAGANESNWSNEIAPTTTSPPTEVVQPPENSNPIELTPENSPGPVPVGSNDTPVVTGTVSINNSGADTAEEVVTVLKINGQAVRTVTGASVKLDTTTLPNGTYTVALESKDREGNSIVTARNLIVDNKLNPFEKARNSLLKPFAGKWSAKTMNAVLATLASMPFILAGTAIWVWAPQILGPKLVRFR